MEDGMELTDSQIIIAITGVVSILAALIIGGTRP